MSVTELAWPACIVRGRWCTGSGRCERKGGDKIKVMQAVAEAMHCRLVYAIVPEDGETLEETAEWLAENPMWRKEKLEARRPRRWTKRAGNGVKRTGNGFGLEGGGGVPGQGGGRWRRRRWRRSGPRSLTDAANNYAGQVRDGSAAGVVVDGAERRGDEETRCAGQTTGAADGTVSGEEEGGAGGGGRGRETKGKKGTRDKGTKWQSGKVAECKSKEVCEEIGGVAAVERSSGARAGWFIYGSLQRCGRPPQEMNLR